MDAPAPMTAAIVNPPVNADTGAAPSCSVCGGACDCGRDACVTTADTAPIDNSGHGSDDDHRSTLHRHRCSQCQPCHATRCGVCKLYIAADAELSNCRICSGRVCGSCLVITTCCERPCCRQCLPQLFDCAVCMQLPACRCTAVNGLTVITCDRCSNRCDDCRTKHWCSICHKHVCTQCAQNTCTQCGHGCSRCTQPCIGCTQDHCGACRHTHGAPCALCSGVPRLRSCTDAVGSTEEPGAVAIRSHRDAKRALRKKRRMQKKRDLRTTPKTAGRKLLEIVTTVFGSQTPAHEITDVANALANETPDEARRCLDTHTPLSLQPSENDGFPIANCKLCQCRCLFSAYKDQHARSHLVCNRCIGCTKNGCLECVFPCRCCHKTYCATCHYVDCATCTEQLCCNDCTEHRVLGACRVCGTERAHDTHRAHCRRCKHVFDAPLCCRHTDVRKNLLCSECMLHTDHASADVTNTASTAVKTSTRHLSARNRQLLRSQQPRPIATAASIAHPVKLDTQAPTSKN